MINRIGLVLFILGCFGCLQETLKPSEWGGWFYVAEFLVVFGAGIFMIYPKEDGE